MKIVDRLVEKFVTKVLSDMEKISDDLVLNEKAKPIEQNMNQLHNDELYRKLYKKQALLLILRVF